MILAQTQPTDSSQFPQVSSSGVQTLPQVNPDGSVTVPTTTIPAPAVDTAVSVVGWTFFALWMTSGAVSAYHGYKRNHDSVGWGLGWGLMGLMFPILAPVTAIAEGYALPLEEGPQKYGKRVFAGPKRRRRIYRRRAA